MRERLMHPRWPRRQKTYSPQWGVFTDVRGTILQAGTLHVAQKGDTINLLFAYTPQYLERARHGEAYPLDPINLPLRTTPFESTGRHTRLGALFDAMPDAWGRKLMALDEDLPPSDLAEEDVLHKRGANGVGAILVSAASVGQAPELGDPSLLLRLPHERDIPQLYETVRAIEAGKHTDTSSRTFLMGGWALGGVRPKAVVQDDQGDEWIVKFPAQADTYSHERVEWANLEMARTLGLPVPALSLYDLPDGSCALLVQRFDRRPGTPGTVPRRLAFLSAASLISPPATFDEHHLDTPLGASIFSYARIADVVRIVSSRVTDDLQDLFARMVLNILVRNTNDHLANIGFLMDPQSPDFRYRLAPCYDMVTQQGKISHRLHVAPFLAGAGNRCASRIGSLAGAWADGLRWGLKPAAIAAIIDQVQTVLAERDDYYLEAGMSEAEIAQVERWIHPEAASARTHEPEIPGRPVPHA